VGFGPICRGQGARPSSAVFLLSLSLLHLRPSCSIRSKRNGYDRGPLPVAAGLDVEVPGTLINLPGWCWAEIQQFALVGSSSSLHSEACNALGASDGVIHSRISQEVVCLRATTNVCLLNSSRCVFMCVCSSLPLVPAIFFSLLAICLCGWAGCVQGSSVQCPWVSWGPCIFRSTFHRDGCRAAIPQTGPCVSSRVVRASGLFGCFSCGSLQAVLLVFSRWVFHSSCQRVGWYFPRRSCQTAGGLKMLFAEKKTETRSEWVVWLFFSRIAASSAPRVFSLGFP